MRSRCGWCYRSSRSRVIVCFVPGVGSCLCLQDASTDLRPYTRPFVSLVFQVYTLDHPLVDLHAFSLGSWPAAFPRLDLGSDSDALSVKQLSALSIISLEGLTARCMAMHFMPTSWAPCFVNWCALTLIPSLHQACSLVQVWEVVFGFIPKKKWSLLALTTGKVPVFRWMKRVNGWISEWMNIWMDGWMDGCMNEQRTNGWMDEWMDGWMNEWMDGWMNGWMDEWMDGWMDEWMDEWMNEWMNEWMDEWMDGWMNECMDGWMDGWMNEWMNAWMWMDGWMDEWMDGWMDEWMNGWMNEWMDGWMDGWMNGWMDEWMNGWMNACAKICT